MSTIKQCLRTSNERLTHYQNKEHEIIRIKEALEEQKMESLTLREENQWKVQENSNLKDKIKSLRGKIQNLEIQLVSEKLKRVEFEEAMQKERALVKQEICNLQEDKFEEISKQVKLKNVAESKVSTLVEKCQKLGAENANYKIVVSKKESAISNVLNINVVLNQKKETLIKDLDTANTSINNLRKKEEERQLEMDKTLISFEKMIVHMKEEIIVLTNEQNKETLDLKREKGDLETGVIEREARIRNLEAKLTEANLKNENLEERVVFIKQENDCIEPRLAEMASTISQEFFQKENEQKQKLEKCKKKLNTIESLIKGPASEKLQKVMELFQSNFESLKSEEIQIKNEPIDVND
jgi:hypothetical protein